MNQREVKRRLEYLRHELRKACISWEELSELQSLVAFIDPEDVELLEAAGVPEDVIVLPANHDYMDCHSLGRIQLPIPEQREEV